MFKAKLFALMILGKQIFPFANSFPHVGRLKLCVRWRNFLLKHLFSDENLFIWLDSFLFIFRSKRIRLMMMRLINSIFVLLSRCRWWQKLQIMRILSKRSTQHHVVAHHHQMEALAVPHKDSSLIHHQT